MPKVILCIPPNYSYAYDYPPLGTPVLAGYLRTKGIETAQWDFNLEYNTYISKEIPDLTGYFERKRAGKSYYSEFLPKYDIELPYEDNTNSSFHFIERLISSEYLLRYIQDAEENTFLQFFLKADIEKKIFDARPTLVGLSIISPAQVIGAFTLAWILKKRDSALSIVIGGQWPTLFREELMKRPDLGALFDYIIVFEGETPLLELVKTLGNRADLAKVPNLIYKSNSKFIQSKHNSVEELDKLACPDFDGLDLSAYKFPYTLTYQSSRECYWNKCAFCVDIPLPKQGYRKRKPELVVEDIKILKERYNPQSIMFSDPAFSPQQMKGISEGLLKEQINIDWWCMARLDPGFTPEILKLAFQAGCFEIDFGFETASGRLLKFLNKGIDKYNILKIIKDCYNAGISVKLQTILGFPSETINEAMDTITFLVENSEFIRGPAFNTYYLTPGNEIYKNPDKYGISFEKDQRLSFQFFHDYTHITGQVDRDMANNLRKIYTELVTRKRINKASKVFLIEDHDEAYRIWKRFQIKNRVVIHIDAHLDFDWIKEGNPINIGNYLYPAIKDGILREIYWIVPSPIWRNSVDRQRIKEWLAAKIIPAEDMQEERDKIHFSILGVQVIICSLTDMPVMDEGIVLDIDTDFFVTSSMDEADFPHKHKRRIWIDNDNFLKIITDKCKFIETVVICYSVKYGYTPVEFKYLADELLTKISKIVR